MYSSIRWLTVARSSSSMDVAIPSSEIPWLGGGMFWAVDVDEDDDAADNDDPGVPWTEDRIVSCGHREHTSHYPCLSARTDTIFTVLGRDAV